MSLARSAPLGAPQHWALGLVAALVLALLPFGGVAHAQEEPDPTDACPEDPPPSDYEDRDEIPEVHVRNVDCVTYRNIALGFSDNTYRPSLSVRRDQMASFIARTVEEAGHELPPPEAHPGFADTSGNTHEDEIRQLAAAGIVLGGPGDMPPTHYGPALHVRRDQMASFLIRAAEWALEEDFGESDQRFEDVPPSNAHFENVNGASERGLALGGPGGLPPTQFGPSLETRRDQMASFLARLLAFIESFDEPGAPTAEPTPGATPETTPAPTAEPLTANGLLQGVPELVEVSATATATNAHVTYRFDEAVNGAEIVRERFFLYGPNTTDQRFVASSVNLSGTQNVVAEFTRDQYDAATTAAVANGAVQDADGTMNPEKGLGLKSTTYAGTTYLAGDVFGPRLVAGTFQTQGPVTTVTWWFDRDVADSTGNLVVYLANGARITEPGSPPHGGFGQCAYSGTTATCQGIFGSNPVLLGVTYDAVRSTGTPARPNYEQTRRAE